MSTRDPEPRSPAGSDAEAPFDPAEGLRLIAAQTARVRATEPDARILFALWGCAWLVGYLALYLTANGTLPGARVTDSGLATPAVWAFIVFAVVIGVAILATIIYSTRGTVGLRGVSARQGAMYGWSWFIGFVGVGAVTGGIASAGASDEVIALTSNALSCLVVGILYMAGGTFWQEPRQYALGVWIIVVAGIALYAGLPHTYLVMALLGGGGFLVGALIEHLHRRRSAGLA